LPSSHAIDHAIVNKERLAHWLEQQQSDENVETFIARYQDNNHRQFRNVTRLENNKRRLQKGKRLAQGTTTYQSNLLAVLIDFSDLTASSPQISRADTDMYYDDYSLSHYNDMLFSNSGFVGPNGQNHQSVAQYFDQESGNTFNFTGEFKGWVRADNNAAYYGGNGSIITDQNVEELVVEAVTKAVANGVDLSQFDNDNDGVVDHLLIFHSSIGEEAGGGALGEDAIWSHSYSVANANGGFAQSIVGSTIKIANYTIQPIDSAPGVVAHEFGHDLGLLDEYDLVDISVGAPVQDWSIMSGGSWVGAISGTQPTTFSPLAREQLQDSLGGNWINQTVIESTSLDSTVQQIVLQPATEHAIGINQLKISLPPTTAKFKTPRSGDYLYHSGQISDTRASLGVDITLPASSALFLSFYAQWDIEVDYDYVQLLVDGVPQSNTQTALSSGLFPNVTNYITGSSTTDVWQLVTFDLNAFAGQLVNIELIYVTDPAINEFGIVVDDLVVMDGSDLLFSADGEQVNTLTLNGFSRITEDLPLEPVSYYLQYRDLTGLDAGLTAKSYEPGLLLWLGDENYTDNNASEHPGHGFISVVDADQNRIGNRDTAVQLRDAAFSLFDQQAHSQDQHLDAQPSFIDTTDYSSVVEPQAGVILPIYNVQFDVIAQTDDSITIALSKPPLVIELGFTANKSDKTLTLSSTVRFNDGDVDYLWNFGDGTTSTLSNPSHSYQEFGVYDVSLTVTDSVGTTAAISQSIVVATTLETRLSATQTLMDSVIVLNIDSGMTPFDVSVDFGDGETYQQTVLEVGALTVEHSYGLSGEYNLDVTVIDALQQEKSYGEKITIHSGLTATFTQTVSDLSVAFVSSIANGLGDKTIEWDFGDGNSSADLSPTHNYATAGTYTVLMNVTDQSQLTISQTTTIVVSAKVATNTSTSAESSSSGGAFGLLILLGLLGAIGVRGFIIPKWLNIHR